MPHVHRRKDSGSVTLQPAARIGETRHRLITGRHQQGIVLVAVARHCWRPPLTHNDIDLRYELARSSLKRSAWTSAERSQSGCSCHRHSPSRIVAGEGPSEKRKAIGSPMEMNQRTPMRSFGWGARLRRGADSKPMPPAIEHCGADHRITSTRGKPGIVSDRGIERRRRRAERCSRPEKDIRARIHTHRTV